jgi:hypothetical protein
MRPIQPAIDPLAHRAAIDALDAQRAAFRRYAQEVDAQRRLAAGGDRAAHSADAAARGYEALDAGVRRLGPVLDRASAAAAPEQARELDARVHDMLREARNAEAAILNLSAQLEAWRAAYGRQLAEAGLAPGGSAADAALGTPGGGGVPLGTRGDGEPAGAAGYGPRGRPGEPSPSRLIDRRG